MMPVERRTITVLQCQFSAMSTNMKLIGGVRFWYSEDETALNVLYFLQDKKEETSPPD